jgi:hypothetical protein
MFSMRNLAVAAIWMGIACSTLSAQGYRGGDARVDYSMIRREIQEFEGILDNVVARSFNGASTFALQSSKGAYLPGYGMTFSFVVNIHRAMINTPFGPKKGDVTTPEEKKKRIEELKEQLMLVLFLRGDSLRQVTKDESVSIIAYFEDRNFPEEENQSKTIVLSAVKRDLEELARKEDRIKEFKQRMKTVEY